MKYATTQIPADTAQPGADFYGTSGDLQFPAGTTQQTFSVTLLDDSLNEVDETFTARIFQPVGAGLGNLAATISIVDDDTAQSLPRLTISDLVVTETDAFARVLVNLSSPLSTGQVSVGYATTSLTGQNNAATPGADFYGLSGTLTFQPGETQKMIDIILVDDALTEVTELLTARIFSSTGAAIERGRATVSIQDDE